MSTDRGPVMSTATGREFYPFSPRPEDIYFEDIALALSKICRFGGHTKAFYSVAQHSVLVSRQLTTRSLKRTGLFHDAAEAYIGDMVTPIKKRLPEFERLEGLIFQAIVERFNLDHVELPPHVVAADRAVLHAEAFQVLTKADWADRSIAAPIKVQPLEPFLARSVFTSEALSLGIKG